jgi:hypothetical protein
VAIARSAAVNSVAPGFPVIVIVCPVTPDARLLNISTIAPCDNEHPENDIVTDGK